MTLDFPLILVALTGLTGIISLIDLIVLAPQRRARAEDFKSRSANHTDLDGQDLEEYRRTLDRIDHLPWPVEYSRSFFPVLFVVLVLRSFLVEPFQIPSSSMVPTLEVGDYILVNKFAYGVRLPVLGTKMIDIGSPKRGDVMVFFPPNDSRYFIKRVIGLPGDRISYRDKRLSINGKPVSIDLVAELPPAVPRFRIADENLGGVTHRIRTELYRTVSGNFSVTVEPGHYFMMGDNRDNSSDSRVWGQVPEKNIVGKAVAIWMHWPKFLSIPSFSRVGAIN